MQTTVSVQQSKSLLLLQASNPTKSKTHVQKNVWKSLPACVDYLLPSHKEMMDMKVAMLASFHIRLELLEVVFH